MGLGPEFLCILHWDGYKMVAVFLGLGSNLGDSRANLEKAISLMQAKTTLITKSKVFSSKPMYVLDQPDFHNQVIKVETGLPPLELLQFIKEVEANVGRVPTFRYGPRFIDIDILYYGDLVARFDGTKLEIPHPRIRERIFVLAPLAEIDPHFVCPRTQLSVQEMLAELKEKGDPL